MRWLKVVMDKMGGCIDDIGEMIFVVLAVNGCVGSQDGRGGNN